MQDVSRRKMLSILGLAPLAVGAAETASATIGTDATSTTSPGAPARMTLSEQARRRIQEQHFPDIPLITHEGKHVRFYNDLIKDKIVSLNFFFAKCDEICPWLWPT